VHAAVTEILLARKLNHGSDSKITKTPTPPNIARLLGNPIASSAGAKPRGEAKKTTNPSPLPISGMIMYNSHPMTMMPGRQP
jgi:hypothetical protein